MGKQSKTPPLTDQQIEREVRLSQTDAAPTDQFRCTTCRKLLPDKYESKERAGRCSKCNGDGSPGKKTRLWA